MAEPASERPSGLPDWPEAADSTLGTSAFSDMAGSLATDSDGLGSDSEAMGMGCELSAKGPSGPLVTQWQWLLPGQLGIPAEFRGSTLS